MRKSCLSLLVVVLMGVMLAACSSGSKEASFEPKLSAAEMTDSMLKQVEQPKLIDLEAEAVKRQYHLDPSLLADYSIKIPLMNVKTNEIAVLKVKDSKDVETVEAAVKQRAEDVQKQFETYLPDQYENAKNYKLVVKGNYVLFVISESADKLTQAFDSFFEQSK